VSFVNDDSNQYGNVTFSANLTLQYTTNGTTWQESGWTVLAVYSYTTGAAKNTYTISERSYKSV
jgi:hypothetical protein